MTGEIEAVGDIATGALAGHAIDPGATGAHDGAAHGSCLNCGTTLIGEHCHQCGQNAHVHRNLHSLFHDLLHGVFHFEGKIWRTLPMLFGRPGSLTRRYIAGERARFVSPLALFLFSVFLMVATFGTIGGPLGHGTVNHNGTELDKAEVRAEIDKEKKREARLVEQRAAAVARGGNTERIDERLEDVRGDIKGLTIANTITEGKLADPVTTIQLAKTGNGWLDTRVKKAAKEPGLFFYKVQSSAYKYSWALIPISLPFIWLLFAFRRDVGPYDHAIFAIYSLSAMTLGMVGLSIANAIGLPTALIVLVILFGPPLHMYKQLKGAYGLTRSGALWRTGALVVSAYVAAFLFFAAIVSTVSG
ncbi:DUF3667 domain-containing protein [Sphingomonas sp.]|uniref:DUF3667 domain-containing protein n=1 Tax=Sphingomonas sp. TaxID=28214 RepID=UPI003D6CDEB4